MAESQFRSFLWNFDPLWDMQKKNLELITTLQKASVDNAAKIIGTQLEATNHAANAVRSMFEGLKDKN
jgi:hypothetical protein